MKVIDEFDVPTLRVSYEELAIYPEEVLPRTCNFVGIEPFEEVRFIKNSSSHIINGNAMRNDESRRQAIQYDNRMLYRNNCLLPSLMMPHVMGFNSREVYQNLRYGIGSSADNWRNIWQRPPATASEEPAARSATDQTVAPLEGKR